MSAADNPLIVGLTGSIGSGKSSAARIFENLGANIIDADLLAREAVTPGTQALAAIELAFGSTVVRNGILDRAALAELVYGYPTKRRELERIIHPEVRRLFLDQLEQLKQDTTAHQLIIYVIPLLFESDTVYPEIQKIVVVSAAQEICLSRIMARDGLTREAAQARYDAQLPIEMKERQADFVILNDAGLQDLQKRVAAVYETIHADAALRRRFF